MTYEQQVKAMEILIAGALKESKQALSKVERERIARFLAPEAVRLNQRCMEVGEFKNLVYKRYGKDYLIEMNRRPVNPPSPEKCQALANMIRQSKITIRSKEAVQMEKERRYRGLGNLNRPEVKKVAGKTWLWILDTMGQKDAEWERELKNLTNSAVGERG